tara:strand:- start:197 stop:916 length:720 start_codon:yes stop_codon:yes gene_type:complete
MLDLSIVIPIYNEETRLQKSLPEIKKFLEQNKKNRIEIIFVSDGSNDNTNLIVEKFKSKKNKKLKIKLIKYKKNIGKGYAVKKGILKAKNSWILICDIDLSVHPNQFKIWYNKNLLKSKKEAYYGSREHNKSKIKASKYRVFLGYFFKKLIRFLFHINLSDTQCGFKVFNKYYSKKIFRKIKSYRFAFDVELTILLNKNKIKIIELPLTWIHKSGSKLSIFKDIPKMVFDIILIKIKNF